MIHQSLKWLVAMGVIAFAPASNSEQSPTANRAAPQRQVEGMEIDYVAAGGVLSRPNRPGHVIGNSVRRVFNRGRFR
jgi:hypothetical protein